MLPCETEYLSEDHLQGFAEYKYSSVDSSPLSRYVMHPFWDRAVKLCPRWLAPNLLTLIGFSCTVLIFCLLSLCDYSYDASSLLSKPSVQPVPRLLWAWIALLFFSAHTLDGIDGKQARRLRMCGPLGELFDHGLDSWTSFFIPMSLYSVFGRHDYSIPAWRMLLALWNVLLSFLLSHWEKYVTGVLFLPWGYDVSQLCVLLVYIATYCSDYTLWKFSIVAAADATPLITSGHVLEVGLWLGGLGVGVPVSLYNIYRSYSAGSCRISSIRQSLVPLISPALLLISTCLWAAFSPSDILNSDLRLFTFLIGSVFSNISCRLIVAQMSGSTAETLNRLTLLVCACAGLVLLTPTAASSALEMPLLQTLTACVTLLHVHYGVCVVRQMCRRFNLPALTVRHPCAD